MNEHLRGWYENHFEKVIAVADDLWEHPELDLGTHYTAGAVANFMEQEGFAVTLLDVGQSGEPNCVIARWGEGHPAVGFVGDMDAYPEAGNRNVPYEDRIEGPGQGCGHNLNTMAGAAAACACKAAMEAEGIAGSVVYFGCPAEESTGGKLQMVRDGYFDEMDVCYQWHSSGRQIVFGEIAVASVQRYDLTFVGDDEKVHSFYGGRTAQDAAELLSLGMGYLRKEFPVEMFNLKNDFLPKTEGWKDRMTVRVEVRYNDYAVTSRCIQRILAIAKGAAMMTGTRLEWKALVVYRDLIPNDVLNRSGYQAAQKVPPIEYDEADVAFAEELFRNARGQEPTETLLKTLTGMPEWYRAKPDGTPDLLTKEPQEPKGCQWIQGGGTDLSEVAWKCPVLFISGPGVPAGVTGHSWAVTAASRSSIGNKAMRFGSQTMAQAAYDLVTHRELFDAVREEFVRRTAGLGDYKSHLPLPVGHFDPLTYEKERQEGGCR